MIENTLVCGYRFGRVSWEHVERLLLEDVPLGLRLGSRYTMFWFAKVESFLDYTVVMTGGIGNGGRVS